MKPHEIERLSFEIIEQEAGSHDFTDHQWQIVRRMIHTSADFDYMKTIRFHPQAIPAGLNAIRSGNNILTDTNMAKSGIRGKDLSRFNGAVHCLINDPSVARTAKNEGTTRAQAAVDAATDLMTGGIYVVGNAPTALIRLMALVREKKIDPALIIGLPVGFVNAAESKEALSQMNIPYVTNLGRKGGSNVAAAVVNALILILDS